MEKDAPLRVRPENRANYEYALKMHKRGCSFNAIAQVINVDVRTVRRWLDPDVLRKHRESCRYDVEAHRRRPVPIQDRLPPAGKTASRAKIDRQKADLNARMAVARHEKRDKTAQFFGDPLHVRSALANTTCSRYVRKKRPIVPYVAETRADGMPLKGSQKFNLV